MNFTLRIYQGERTSLSNLRDITISGITLINKYEKYQVPFVVKTNKEKFKYSVKIKGRFLKGGGSHNYPCISFKGDYIDIEVKDFPRYPAFGQDRYAARDYMNGWGYTNHLNKGFPIWEQYRKVEILNIH